ncbi:MAG: DUF3365 domain-containing protein [Gammaproteobacteria bacterium]|nr:DUF3365 domain-containing protein [Gammaproteobacteria bacterium]
MQRQLIVAAMLVLATAACTKAPAPVDATARGAKFLAPFKADLKAALLQGMESGPAEAVAVCRDQAPQIAAALSVDGVSMGRSSHRLRNPANAPQDWLAPIVAGFADGTFALAPQVVDIGDGRTGYVEPIVVQPLCLTCHGTDVQPELAARIAELYPDDAATGFAAGDVRGVFWVAYRP